MPPKFSIRRATASDAEGILECLHLAFAPYEQLYPPAGFRDTILTPETIHHRLKAMTVLVAVSESGQIVGTIGGNVVPASSKQPVASSEKEGHIRGMAVLPQWQGKQHGTGVAEELLRAAEGELRQLGCTRVTLDTTEPLQRAIRFYERNGYRASGKVGDFFGMPLLEYVKQLGPE